MAIHRNNIIFDKAPQQAGQSGLFNTEQCKCDICKKVKQCYIRYTIEGEKQATCEVCRRKNAQM